MGASIKTIQINLWFVPYFSSSLFFTSSAVSPRDIRHIHTTTVKWNNICTIRMIRWYRCEYVLAKVSICYLSNIRVYDLIQSILCFGQILILSRSCVCVLLKFHADIHRILLMHHKSELSGPNKAYQNSNVYMTRIDRQTVTSRPLLFKYGSEAKKRRKNKYYRKKRIKQLHANHDHDVNLM